MRELHRTLFAERPHRVGSGITVIKARPIRRSLRYPGTIMRNLSVPSDTLVGHVVYEDLPRAIEFLCRAFGFREHFRYGPPDAPKGAQLLLEGACIMVRTARAGSSSPARCGCMTQSLTVFVEGIDAHYEHAKAADGVKIVEELHETEYGERQYGAVDLEGHHWLFAWHARDVAPQEWGAIVSH